MNGVWFVFCCFVVNLGNICMTAGYNVLDICSSDVCALFSCILLISIKHQNKHITCNLAVLHLYAN